MAGRDGGTSFDGPQIAAAARAPRIVRRATDGRDGPVRLLNDTPRTLVTDSRFFGPGQPLLPAAPAEAAGRALDFPFGYNTAVQPRPYEPIDFPSLRGLADASDLVRLAVETRKDQMGKLRWTVKRKDGEDQDDTAKAIEDFLQMPDREHDFADWKRMLYEDLLVIDAPSVYLRRTRGGAPFALEVIDGATIARKINGRGRTPEPPEPAYQQIIKGMAAVNYTSEELLYKPRNPRPHKVYGYSPVEQVIVIINIALRRQVHQLQAYTEGNVPEALATVPKDWTTAQVAEFQAYWDVLLSGDTAARRHVRFVPGEMKFERLHTDPLFDLGDEWLARVVSYAFSLPPSAYVKQQNRATQSSAQEVALEEGLAPLMEWDARYMTRLISMAWNTTDYEFGWLDEQDVDPEVQAKVDDLYVRMGVRSTKDIADDHGWGAPPPPPAPISAPGEPPINGAAPSPTLQPGADAAKLRKARSRSRAY
jgi:hypothetical protein